MAQPGKTDACGCCEGISQETPLRLDNLPSQKSIHYRVGTHARFKQSMLAALSKADYPALQALSTREDDDFTIAYLDAVATVLDVLSFYQERYVNENYLNTCGERRSVLEMAQLIGYELSPGVAAATHLAFTLQSTPGTPNSALSPITIPATTRVQSVPEQNEDPQIFETTQDIEARAAWNAVATQTLVPYVPALDDTDVYIDGISNNIEVGDAILIVGRHRKQHRGSERWDVRVVKQVDIDNAHLRTRLSWDTPLGHTGPTIHPAETDVGLFVFRSRTSLFGHNAPDPRLMSAKDNELGDLTEGKNEAFWWKDYTIKNNEIDLASADDKVVAGSWVALVSNDSTIGTEDLPGYVELYRADTVSTLSRTDYGISGKVTRIDPDTSENIDEFELQKTLVLAASEELAINQRPLLYPLYGDSIALATHIDGLVPEQYLAVSGRRQRLKVAPGESLELEHDAGSTMLNEGDSVIITGIPVKLVGSTQVQLVAAEFGELIDTEDATIPMLLEVMDRDQTTGTVLGHGADWRWDSDDNDSAVAEIAQINDSEESIENDRDRTRIALAAALGNIYQRDSVAINFNVAPANNGETISDEILGDGDARESDQQFQLKHAPLTYVSAGTPSGGAAELEVRVNDLLWSETDSLYQQDSDARVYKVVNHNDGSSAIRFGDGIEGGRLPTGTTNVRASYRKYVGSAANLASHSLTTLLQKPLGVTEVTNPEPATGGADAEVIEDARQNAPLTVLTLDRAVSVLDYQYYARAFSGVAKAHALWISSGPSRGVYITLAGIEGAEIPQNSDTYANLSSSLQRYGDPLLPLSLVNYTPAEFILGLAVRVDETAERETVLEQLDLTLRDYFSFDNRDFGQHVSQDEIMAVAHSVDHVEAVRITRFYKDTVGAVDTVEHIIPSHLPIASLTEAPEPAELLTLSAQIIEMGVFS